MDRAVLCRGCRVSIPSSGSGSGVRIRGQVPLFASRNVGPLEQTPQNRAYRGLPAGQVVYRHCLRPGRQAADNTSCRRRWCRPWALSVTVSCTPQPAQPCIEPAAAPDLAAQPGPGNAARRARHPHRRYRIAHDSHPRCPAAPQNCQPPVRRRIGVGPRGHAGARAYVRRCLQARPGGPKTPGRTDALDERRDCGRHRRPDHWRTQGPLVQAGAVRGLLGLSAPIQI